ncbi:EF-hand domain-containing protein [Streptomyces iconiensis]|uniref:EF-hand domain-containing protein n=1 Tax=Streptomyces iconiensis TaxID=1384038 RepID=A0ABT7AA12_9ACTN|nr:hypothetical protein [Streptomyces iconiensis]MDJ1138196.1 hypothetical protein [Streptomyces iconiensis]
MSPPVWPFRRRGPNGRTPGSRTPPAAPTGPEPLDPLLRWKLDRWFDCLVDAPSGTGRRSTPVRLTFRDYELAATRVARAFRHRPGSREHRRLLACLRKLWRLHDREGTGALDREAFAACVARALRRERRSLVAAVNSLCCAMVDIADVDGDSLLSEREYRALLAAGFRLDSEHDLRTAYRTLDRDNSGTLEHNEVHEAFVEFFTSTDPDSPGNWLLGGPRPPHGGRGGPYGS